MAGIRKNHVWNAVSRFRLLKCAHFFLCFVPLILCGIASTFQPIQANSRLFHVEGLL